MSTRATILIKEHEVEYRVYHHCDGYPEGVGADLKDYLNSRSNWYGSYWYADQIVNDLVKGLVKNDKEYRITSCQHGDEEYAYLIDCDKKELKCYSIGWDDFDWTDDKLVEIP